MLKTAVIGTGSMGRNHVRVYRELEDVELVGIADEDPRTAQKIGATFVVPHYADYRKMLEERTPTLVSLTVPTVQHFEIARDLLSRGIHVLVEKPITSTLEQGEALVEFAQKQGLVLSVGHVERFNPAVTELRRRLREGMAGRVYQIHAQRLSPFPARIRDAGVVIDLASHDIDLMRHLVNEPIERVYGETIRSINSDREDMFNGLIRFRNGVLGVLDVNWMTPAKIRKLTVTGTRGMFICALISQELFFHENETAPSQWDQLSILRGVSEGNVLGIRIQRQEPLTAEIRDVCEAVRELRTPTVTGVDGLETLRIALWFVRSGQQVAVIDGTTGERRVDERLSGEGLGNECGVGELAHKAVSEPARVGGAQGERISAKRVRAPNTASEHARAEGGRVEHIAAEHSPKERGVSERSPREIAHADASGDRIAGGRR